jgi:hypothetical protein
MCMVSISTKFSTAVTILNMTQSRMHRVLSMHAIFAIIYMHGAMLAVALRWLIT